MALWPGLFVHSEAMPSFGKQYLSTIRNFQGAQFSLSESYLKKKKKEREREKNEELREPSQEKRNTKQKQTSKLSMRMQSLIPSP